MSFDGRQSDYSLFIAVQILSHSGGGGNCSCILLHLLYNEKQINHRCQILCTTGLKRTGEVSMYEWSVLNDSLLECVKTANRCPVKYFDIISVLFQIQNVTDQEYLYRLTNVHRHWESPLKNRVFFSGLNLLRDKFGDFFINMLIAEFSDVAYIPQNGWHEREFDYARLVVEGAADIFPELTSVEQEVLFNGFRVDIFANVSASGREVLFELKRGDGDPTSQLLRYAVHFDNPILIGITEKELPRNKRCEDICYLTYEMLNRRAAANIIRQFGNKTESFEFCSTTPELDRVLQKIE